MGLNFATDSPRYLSMDKAREIRQAITGQVTVVGVFVNSEPAEVIRVADDLDLDVVQLHGDESPADCLQIGRPVVKSLPFGSAGIAPLIDFFQATVELGGTLEGLLIDASVAGRYGGTGETVDWSGLANEQSSLSGIPWALAGGLNPENVAEAVTITGCKGVDVASGVETSLARKDAQKVVSFVTAAAVALRA